MQRDGQGNDYGEEERSFNPHPARRPDATRDRSVAEVMAAEFQSSSSQKAGCNLVRTAAASSGVYSFQSSSSQKAGCNPFGC